MEILIMNFTNKTVIITGSTRGIGKSIALSFAQLGANLVINGVPQEEEQGKEVVKEIESLGAKAILSLGSVADMSVAQKIVNDAKAAFGTVDVVVNNAGITRDNLVMRMSEEDFDSVIAVNLKGAFNMVKTASAVMLKQRSGAFVNIASVVGVMGNAGQANYAASKAGLIGLTKSIAKEFAARGVRANAIAPGFIATDMTDRLSDDVKSNYMSNIPLKKFGSVDDVANAVLFLSSDMSGYITGQTLHVCGGLLV